MNDNITWTYHSRASIKHKYLTVAVPKVACSTIKRTLHVFEGLGQAERLALEHGAGEEMRLSRLSKKAATDALNSPEWLRFVFVRNPYDRLLSAWKSKISSSHDTHYEAVRQEMRARLGHHDVTFGDFVRCLTSSADAGLQADGHWERQTVVGLHDVIDYDVIARFENFAAEFRAILQRLGAPADVVALADEVTNPTEPMPLTAAYDSDLAAIVYTYYREDFERFGYERDSWFTPKQP
jgi:hypothetical protein